MNTFVRLTLAAFAMLAVPRVSSAQPAPAPAPDAAAPPAPDSGAPPGTSTQPPAPLPPTTSPPAAAPAAPVAPAASPAVPRGPEWTSLRLLHDKGVISDAELASALADIGVVGAGDATTVVVSKLKTTLYGYLEGNFKYDSTQTCLEFCGSTQVQRPGTYRGNHGRTVFSARDSRLGIRLAAPEEHGIRVSGVLETDFFGPTTTTEQGTYVNPVLRIRASYLKIETPVLDVLIGQQFTLFGWQPVFVSASVQYPGLPGEAFERTPQLRLSKTLKSDTITTEIAIAANRPPQQDSATPEGVAGLRLQLNRWTGAHTAYMAYSTIQPASIAISGDIRRFRIPELAVTPHSGITRTGGGVAFDAYFPIIPATKASKDNALALNAELSITSGMADDYSALGGAGTANAAIPPATAGGTAVPYTPNFDAGLAAIDAAGNVELIKWLAYLVSLEFYPGGTGGRLGLVANYAHMASSNARSVGTASSAAGMAAQAAAARIRDHEDFFEIGVFVDPTRSTRIAASGSLYSDVYGDGATAKNYSVIMSGWLFF
ncbi:MAG: hypothetical protein E6J90_33940 [Deltaproteobacteria bacterium]|nr:MAG: hypothetical protein E6J91_34740 [Deltaproteobacteria bacterium]TMQ11718.1 MAG: hypothetical protein E6J90_33940 [Deltaproteobacteria bacterium]